MAIDFPSSPGIGQLFAATGGKVYTFTATGWEKATLQTALQRNRVVNGAMAIAIENFSKAAGTAAAGYFSAEQWATYYSGTMVITSQNVASTTPQGSRYRTRMTVTTAKVSPLAAGDYVTLQQTIEGMRIADFKWGTAAAQQVVLRFGFKGPAGTYTFAFRNAGGARSYVGSFTISAGQANTDTEWTFAIPGDTTGTWLTDTAYGAALTFTIAAGTTYQGAAGWQAGNFISLAAGSNGVGTATVVFEVFDVGLYLDPLKTGRAPPWEILDEGAETLQCMRYFNVLSHGVGVSTTTTNAARLGYRHPMMRIAPAGSIMNISFLTVNDGTGSPVPSGFSFFIGTPGYSEMNITVASGITAGRSCALVGAVNTGIALNARM